MAHSSLRNHRKFMRLKRRLPEVTDVTLVGHLEFFWWTCHEDRSIVADGKLTSWRMEDIEAAAQWTGDDGVLAEALIYAGFIDSIDGSLFVHDYKDWVPYYVKRRWKSDTSDVDQPSTYVDQPSTEVAQPSTYVDECATNVDTTQHNTTQHKKKKTIAADKPPPHARERDLLWDAVQERFYPNGIPPSLKGLVGSAVADFRAQNAQPSEIKPRADNYATHMPECPCTPKALAKHWELCSKPKGSKDPSKVRDADMAPYMARVIRYDESGRQISGPRLGGEKPPGGGEQDGTAPAERCA